jgi:hypothetical protein
LHVFLSTKKCGWTGRVLRAFNPGPFFACPQSVSTRDSWDCKSTQSEMTIPFILLKISCTLFWFQCNSGFCAVCDIQGACWWPLIRGLDSIVLRGYSVCVPLFLFVSCDYIVFDCACVCVIRAPYLVVAEFYVERVLCVGIEPIVLTRLVTWYSSSQYFV